MSIGKGQFKSCMKSFYSGDYCQKKSYYIFISFILFTGYIPFIFSQSINKTPLQANSKETINKFEINGLVLIGNVGFAPIPAFSFDSPILTGSLCIKTKKLTYQPDFSIGLNGKPWMINHWIGYTIAENQKYKIYAGVNPSLFFKNEFIDSGLEIVHAHRNITIELAGTRKISKRLSMILTYLHIKAFDPGTLSGDFVDLSVTAVWTRVFTYFEFHLKPQVFYFDLEGNINGLYTSNTISLTHPFIRNKISLSAYFQGVLPVKTDFPGNTFKWNAGFRYDF